MSFASEFHVPGAYHFDTTTRSGSTLSAGIFRPPASPSASTYNLAKSTGSLYSDISMGNTPAAGTAKRKRTGTRESTPVEWSMNMDGANDARDEDRTAAGGRQIRYNLAGQINATPAGAPNGAENGILEDSVYSDVDYRRALGPKDMAGEVESPSVQFDIGGLNLGSPNASTATGWSSLALNTIGDVVGKVWEFCKTGAFRGFHAGGGEGYDLRGSTTPSQSGKPWCNEHDIPTLPSDDPPFNQLPGQFPQSDFMPFSPELHEMSTPEATPRPAAKRRQVSGHDELKRNWVLVDEPGDQKPRSFGAALSKAAPRPGAPRPSSGRGRPGYYTQTAASSGRRISVPVSRLGSGTPASLPRGRASLRISHSGSPSLGPGAVREPASFAPPRSPIGPSFRSSPSRIPVPAPSSSQQPTNPFTFPGATSVASMVSRPSSRQSLVQSPAPNSSPARGGGHRRNNPSVASAAPTARRARTDHVSVDDIQASPRLDAEAKQLAQKKIAAERDADAKVDAFNARLLRMIRQGKEALGTRVEVLDDGEEHVGVGGWEDDEDD